MWHNVTRTWFACRTWMYLIFDNLHSKSSIEIPGTLRVILSSWKITAICPFSCKYFIRGSLADFRCQRPGNPLRFLLLCEVVIRQDQWACSVRWLCRLKVSVLSAYATRGSKVVSNLISEQSHLGAVTALHHRGCLCSWSGCSTCRSLRDISLYLDQEYI